MVQQALFPLVSMRMWVRSLACSVGQESGIAMSCSVGHRCGSDPALLWLSCRPAAAAPIQPLGWELPYATLEALESGGKKKGKKKKRIYIERKVKKEIGKKKKKQKTTTLSVNDHSSFVKLKTRHYPDVLQWVSG